MRLKSRTQRLILPLEDTCTHSSMTPKPLVGKEKHSQLQPQCDAFMADPSIFDPLRISTQTLAALDWRPFHFALQPYHYLVRMVHIIAMGAFFGGIGLLDFRLMGWRGTVPLRGFAGHVLPWLWVTFGIVTITGLALFFYDPVHVGTHAYWAPKLVAIALGLANAALFVTAHPWFDTVDQSVAWE